MSNMRRESRFMARNAIGFFGGLLIGALAGATAMMLLAPRSGREMRARIQESGTELRDQGTKAVNETVRQARDNALKVASELRKQADGLERRGQDLLHGQRETVAAALEAHSARLHKMVSRS